MLEISGQYGDSIASDVYWPMHKRLNELFEERMRKNYGTQITMLCVVLRVSGVVQDFGTESAERLFHRRKAKYLEIDLAIPRKTWEEQPLTTVRNRLMQGLRTTFAVLKEKLAEVDRKADVASWEADFEACLQQFAREAGSREEARKFTSAKGREMFRRRREQEARDA